MAQLTHFYMLLPFSAFTLPPQWSPGQIHCQETSQTQQPHLSQGGALWACGGTDSPGFTCQCCHFLAGTKGLA